MEKSMELIERYLYDVVRRLPEKQREDIRKELQGLIEDMLEERQDNGKNYEENVKEVLEALGDPAELAGQYRGGYQWLIGGDYYPLYCQILKIVLICVSAGMVISCCVGFGFAMTDVSVSGFVSAMTKGFMDLFMQIPAALLQAFGMLTLVFVVMERRQVKMNELSEKWQVEKLPEIPGKKAVIKRGESIVGIVFSVCLSVLFVSAPEYMGVWLKDGAGSVVVVPFFNMSIFHSRLLPILLVGIVAGIVNEFTKLIVGRYCMRVLWVNTVCSVISAVSTLWLLLGGNLWNPELVEKISSYTGKTFDAEFDIMSRWNDGQMMSIMIIALVLFGCIVEIVETAYRTFRYGMKGNR